MGLPAHDLVGEENPAHLGVFVLAFVNDRLGKENKGRKETCILISANIQPVPNCSEDR